MRLTCAAVLLAGVSCLAQEPAGLERYIAAHQPQILRELTGLLEIPNIAEDRASIRRNAERLAVLYYIHYDGQPVDRSRWPQPDPFRPVLRAGRLEDGAPEVGGVATRTSFPDEWRLYGRSASDDKSPIVAFCAALDALPATGRKPGENLRVILDGEEEAGSPSLAGAIGRYQDKLRADLLIILDGPEHPSGKPTLSFGARGIVTLELTVYGPKFALHSGHYGNWAPHPAMELAQLLASMKDGSGRVAVQGFYEGIPPLALEERRMLAGVPDDLAGLKKLFGIARPEGAGESLQEAIQFPSLNIRGLRSGYVGADARTVIPAEATTALDIRLVKETPAAEITALGCPAIGLSIVNFDNNQHSENENLRLGNLWRGIVSIAATV